MAHIKVDGGNSHYGQYIKEIDKANATLSFTPNKNDAYERCGGFYVDAEIDYLIFHFKDKYPEVEYLIETD